MDYLALYRKYRPTDFSSVVGQIEIKKILLNSVENNTISHAYLFSGPRGTGKTTTAKILAKMVNCENLNNGEPCNHCASCLNLFINNDVIEIDAASNNGVDEIRDLREKANLVPSICKYKVYIIDEVHMLTTQAFNALLKILEEPPKHVIFILATTEYHKIPLTITSRCQKFQFNKLEIEEIVKRLREISSLENIKIDDDALYEIAKISEGGMRDSINYLDQIRSFTSDSITINDVYDVCGNVSSEEISILLEDMSLKNFEKVTLFFEKMNDNGKNFKSFFEDMECFLKDVILYKRNVSDKLIKTKIQYIKKISDLYTENDIFCIIDMINSLMDKLRYTSRQSVIVISNFLLILNKLKVDSSGDVNKNNLLVDNVDSKKEEYKPAFEFTVNNKDTDCELTSKSLQSVSSNKEKLNNNNTKNKEIIINNAFASASKKIKSDLQEYFLKIDDYLTNKKFTSAAALMIDTNLEVAGEGYVILTGKYDAIVNNIYYNYSVCQDFINMLFKNEFKMAVITIDEWNRYRDDYVKNVRSGKKYNIIEMEKTIVDNEILDREPTITDKLVDLVGKDIIEFK